ncbi:MAG TPA: CHAT domain-containing protein [Streptosporangiaceae bacterium]|nr:CHAT domain-containing protein [Streptosporangiaceae bacterium]
MSAIEVAIGPGPAGYRVDVVRSPAGEASATVTLDAEALLARRKELQHAVLASSVPTRRLLDESEQSIREVGQALFKALLGTGEVAGRYRAAAAVAAERQESLRVVLRIDDPALAGLPWEAMYDDGAGAYVCRRDQLVRHVGVPAAVAPLAVTAPLRILGIVSSPRGLYPLDVEKEKDNLTNAIAGTGSVQLTWAESATWADLQDVLQSGTWHVVHFIGHGDFDPDRDEGVLALTGQDGRKDVVEASRFVDLLRESQPMPRLVVLNSCSGASASVTDLFSGTAAALVRGGVTAVAAMQYEITDQAAIAFARGFYGAIACGRGVDEAISSARVAILGLSGKTLEWVTPVLYLRGNDSHLSAISAVRHATGRGRGSGQAENAAGTPAARQIPSGERTRALVPSQLVRTMAGHTDPVWSVAFSPDGALLASASGDRTVRLWNPATGTSLRTLTGHADAVRGVAFSPDGALLASASRSPDSSMLASAGNDQTVRIWDPAAGTQVRELAGHTGRIFAVTFSRDGNLLASAGDDRKVRLWDPATGTLLRALTGHTGAVQSLAFSPDGSMLASAGDDQTVRIWG